MIITIKTLQQKSFKVEIDETETVSALKKKIEEEQGAGFPAVGIRLIYAGKILSDATLISEYKIQESNFVVVMVSKTKTIAPKQAPATSSTSVSTPTQQTTATPQETSTSDTAQPQAVADTPVDPTPAPTPAPTPTSGVVSPSEQSSSEAGEGAISTQDRGGDEAGWVQPSQHVITTRSELDETVATLMATTGYDNDRVLEALAATYNDPNRAAQFLLGDENLPGAERMEGEAPPQAVAADQAPGQQPQAGNPVSPPASGPGNPPAANPPASGSVQFLETIRQNPQFQQLRRVVRENPHMLQTILQQMHESNPELLSAIQQYQAEFVEMLNEGSSEQESGDAGAPQAPGAGAGFGAGSLTIQVTPEEKKAIDEIKAMGFPEHMVVQAYMACERNKEYTIDFLLNQDPNDD